MPLAAPVMRATLPSSFMGTSLLFEVVVDDLAKAEGEIGENMGGRDDLAHRQRGDRRESMRTQVEHCRARPGTLHDNVFKAVIDDLQYAWASIDMRNDFQKVVRLDEACVNRVEIE